MDGWCRVGAEERCWGQVEEGWCLCVEVEEAWWSLCLRGITAKRATAPFLGFELNMRLPPDGMGQQMVLLFVWRVQL